MSDGRNQPSASQVNSSQTTVLVDAHVHLYDCFDLLDYFDAARRNFSAIAQSLSAATLTDSTVSGATFSGTTSPDSSESGTPLPGANPVRNCLLCVDLQDKSLTAEQERLSQIPGYTYSDCHSMEPFSGCVTHNESGFAIEMIWGHQIVTAENLELLCFNLPTDVQRGIALADLLEIMNHEDAFAILPWGFGKWWGRRGRVVDQTLVQYGVNDPNTQKDLALFVGDNGGRPRLTASGFPIPGLIDQAVKAGIWNISGSDPLPFSAQASKPGSHGVILQGAYDASRPHRSVNALLRALSEQPGVFGAGERWVDFFKSQVRMQLRKSQSDATGHA